MSLRTYLKYKVFMSMDKLVKCRQNHARCVGTIHHCVKILVLILLVQDRTEHIFYSLRSIMTCENINK